MAQSEKESPTKGKRSLMDMFNGRKSTNCTKKNGAGSAHTPVKKKKSSMEKIAFRDVLSPNTRQLVNTTRVKANKIFNDSVHTHITLEPVCVRIVDTPQYQRLHGLKQLGTCDFVFRGATHTRFEHSLGVAHMAARVVRTIKNNQPELGITDKDVMCVKIAGLCHDLGHGPFSHVFDGVFIKMMYPNGIDGKGKKWRHEDGSVEMFRYLREDNDIDLVGEFGLDAVDVIFIEEIISGTKEGQRKGRDKSKFFLYDVVNNARSGLDVDKLDYFQRDMSRSGISTGTTSRDFDRFIELAYVMRAEPINPWKDAGARGGKSTNLSRNGSFSSRFGGISSQSQASDDDEFPLMICYPEKMVRETVSLFATRFNMHQQVYTHKSVKQVEFMITDALQLADPYIRIQGNVTDSFPQGEYKMSETIFDMKAFMNMKDSILDIICHAAGHNPLLKPAQELIGRIHRRKLYRYVGMTSSLLHGGGSLVDKSEKEILEELLVISMRNSEEEEASFNLGDDDRAQLSFDVREADGGGCVELNENDLIVEKMHIHYGMKSENPVDRMRFFPKHSNLQPHAVARRIDECVYETVLPRVFEDRAIRLFCRDPEKADAARAIFEKWCEEANAQMPFPSLSQPENSQLSQHSIVGDGDIFFSEEL